MFDSIAASVREQISSLDSPLFQLAFAVQDEFAAGAPQSEVSGSDAASTVGHLARGPVSAGDIAAAQLDVPGDIDHARARAEADRVLQSIDFSRPDITIWVPATGSHSAPAEWDQATEAAFGDRASRVTLDYPASVDFNDSVSTGMEALRLVLQGIAERGGSHRVTLGGHSQGAWVIGDAIADPALGRAVDRAVLFGHPSPARVDWARSGDPAVRQVDDPGDPFTHRLTGVHDALDAIDDVGDAIAAGGEPLEDGGLLSRLGTVAGAVLKNPAMAAYLVGRSTQKDHFAGEQDPHHYETLYTDGAAFLAER